MSILNINNHLKLSRWTSWTGAFILASSVGLLASCSSNEETESDAASEEPTDEKTPVSVTSTEEIGSDPSASGGSETIGSDPDVVERPSVTSGIRPVKPSMLGLCRLPGPNATTKQKRECKDYLPADIDQLEPGSYVLHAGLHVPKEDAGQAVQFVTFCRKNGTDRERREGKPSAGTVSPGNPETGYRFWGTSIDVPDDAAWASDCTWEFSAGDNRFVGSWAF